MPQLVDVGSNIYVQAVLYIYNLIRKATDSSTRHCIDEWGVEPDRLRGITLLVPQVS